MSSIQHGEHNYPKGYRRMIPRLCQLVNSRTFLLLLFLGFLLLRLVHLLADPPQNLSWSLGLFFDEGIYNHNARNKVLFGQWRLDEWNDFYYAPLSSLLKYWVFKFFGVGRIQMRLVSVVFSWFSLIFVYFGVKESYNKRTGFLAVLLLGINYIYLMYNRLGMQDTQTLALFILTFYFWQKGIMSLKSEEEKGEHVPRIMFSASWEWYFFLTGVFCFITYTFKNLFLYLLPAPFAALIFYALLQSSYPNRLRRYGTAIAYLVSGCVLSFLLWFTLFYLPNKHAIQQFGSYMMSLMFPKIYLKQLLVNIFQTPFFHYFSKTPVILLGSLFFLFYIYYLLCSEKRAQIHPTDIFLTFWFWAAFLFTGMLAYRPTRYFLPIIPPMCLLTARLIYLSATATRISFPKKLHWGFPFISVAWLTLIFYYGIIPLNLRYFKWESVIFEKTQRGLLISFCIAIVLTMSIVYCYRTWRYKNAAIGSWRYFIVLIIIFLTGTSIYLNGEYYYQWVRAPEYTIETIGQELVARLGKNVYIGGMDAPGVAFDTPYKTLFSWDNFVNYRENPIEKYKLTHLFLADSKNVSERRYYIQKYPHNMARATLLEQYEVKDATYNLFSLIEPQLLNVWLEKTKYAPQEPLQVKLLVKNNDFRDSKKLCLNWFLYPSELSDEAIPASEGQKSYRWFSPEQEQECLISGKAPESRGLYNLLFSWDTIKENRFDVETMRHQIGTMVHDIGAMEDLVVHHDPAVFPNAGYLAFGNYHHAQPGMYEAIFRVKASDNSSPEEIISLDVVADFGKTVLQQKHVRGIDFTESGKYRDFILPFVIQDGMNNVEYRVYSQGKAELWIDEIHTIFQEGLWYNKPIVVQ